MLCSTILAILVPKLDVQDVKFASKDRKVSLSISRQSGRFEIKWGKEARITQSFGEVRLADGKRERTDARTTHKIESRPLKDSIGEGLHITVRHLRDGSPELRHTFCLYNKNAEASVRLDIVGAKDQGARQLIPVISESPVEFAAKGAMRSLFVPYDNDSYSRYSSEGWGHSTDDPGSYEVGALYDDESRKGLVIGSIDHDQWKSGVKFYKGGGLQITAGVTSKHTHDSEVHGAVLGKEVRSPRFTLGLYSDWRKGLERYGDLNAKIKPLMKWNGKVPFGWNSWSGHKSKLKASDADTALEFIRDDLPQLRNDGTAYINLDSYWDNLSKEQLTAFVYKAHAAGLKAGVYWAPFVNWGEPDWKTVGNYHFRDIQLKSSTGQLLPKLDSGWPLDPTHPGTLQRIDEQMKEFADRGFDFIKLDFMTHGALEAKHFDSSISTGTEAYNFGMKYLVKSLQKHKGAKPMFISLSIAPLFPHGYAHSRRISCDAFASIGASEYLLNSQNYGWWTAGRLYQFNDPDHTCVYQAEGEEPTTEAEARTRLTASVVSGGMMLQGDNLTLPSARQRVLKVFSNKQILELAAGAPTFRPIDGGTGEVGGKTFIHQQSADVCYVALFNFDKLKSRNVKEALQRLGLTGAWSAKDLWTGNQKVVQGELTWTVGPADSVLLKLLKH